MYNPHDPQSLEKYSSAVSLSDMEVFIFPELLYSLVLANTMSPILWNWSKRSWFDKFEKLSPYRKVLRVKQFIMDQFTFNLDLDTWGLTTKEREMARFSSFIDEATLARSNALFGYEGDKYYFDIDIRRHFGLDKYDSDIIPYWKTETIDAMEAFRLKEGYTTGAGECVSLATLYAAAMAVVARVPLADIYLMATPLHSQNFIDINDGIITNNRRIVTKKMWYNGTELSGKARRALEHENVTVVSHHTGYIHTLYPEATIDPTAYDRFSRKINNYLSTDITYDVLAAFLREHSELQRCFQLTHACCGKPRYIEAEKVYAYEHGGKFRVGDETQNQLLHDIDEDDFYPQPIEGRIKLDDIEEFFSKNPVHIDSNCMIESLKRSLSHQCFSVETMVPELIKFCKTEPRLPQTNRTWQKTEPIMLDQHITSREDAISYLKTLRETNPTVDLAFMAYRDMTMAPWKPFIKAAIERNPVSITKFAGQSIADIAATLQAMPNESIYDGNRMAQPDEVINYGRGDGLEKAITLMNIVKGLKIQENCRIEGDKTRVVIVVDKKEFSFETTKQCPLPTPDDFVF